MPIVEVNDLARVGQINDIAPYMLPPEAWTVADNIRYEKGSPTVLAGWEWVFGNPAVAPHFAMSVKGPVTTWWLYADLATICAYNGTTHAGLTGGFSTTGTEAWNGCMIGGIPIFNNGSNLPHAWIGTQSLSLPMVPLPNWPGTLRCSVMRNFGSYLVAFNITDSGVNYPHLVQWSNPAAPGTVPTSWAYGNPTVEGGRKDLPDTNAGIILEAMQLGSTMFIYKERSIWKMNYIGGTYIYQFDTFLADTGILAPRCVCMDVTGTKHVVVTNDDIIVHNGNSVDSILTDRQRVTLFSAINRDTSYRSFMFTNKPKDEVWFCFPEQGQAWPTRALIWNSKGGKGAISYATGINFRNAAVGDLQGVNPEVWDSGTDNWDVDTGPWSQIFKQKIILCAPDPRMDLTYSPGRFYQLDMGITRDVGPLVVPTLAREDLGVVGQKRSGELINDFKQMKMVDSVWPKMTGAPVRLRVGFRETVGGPLVWQDYTNFDPATDLWVNTIVNENLPGCGKAVSIEFTSDDLATWKLDGYSMNIEVVGPF